MDDDDLTDAERRYREYLEKRPTTVKSRILGWALELIPSIGLFGYGLYSDRRLFMVLGFLSLLYFTVWRMYGQFRGFRMMMNFRQEGEVDSDDR